MRDAALEKQAEQTLKQKQRERVQPKMNRLDIDYTKLYNAFFKFQTKPELTRYGEVYYEGKEFETNLKHLRPGELSDELKEALGMQPGFAPPWLLNMQRFGPPPSYPALRIPGVNAPPPPGSSWGFNPGQYGKPPVDDNNKPLFGGDIFGLAQARQADMVGDPINKELWGELQPPEEESEEEEDDEEEEGDEEEEDGPDPSGVETGYRTGLPSDIGGMESVAGDFNLRKQRGYDTEETSAGPRQAYQVLEAQKQSITGFMGSDVRYDLKGTHGSVPMLGSNDSRKRKAGDVDVSVDLEALQREGKLSKEEVARQYEAQRQDQTKQWTVDQDDLTQMIAEESRKRLKKDQERRDERRGGRR
jgi:splicing factor 3B subunit 2